jgi:hypothetical protein
MSKIPCTLREAVTWYLFFMYGFKTLLTMIKIVPPTNPFGPKGYTRPAQS